MVELAWDVIVLYFVTDRVREPDRWLERVEAVGPRFDEVLDAKLRSLHALTRIHHGDYTNAHDIFDRALRVFESRDMDFESAVVLHQLGFVWYRESDPEAARAALQRSTALFDGLGHDWGVALAEAMLGSIDAATGDLASADVHQQESLRRARAIDSDQQVVQALGQLTLIRLLEGRTDEALHLITEAVPALRRSRLRADAANALDALAVVARERGALAAAADAVATSALVRDRLKIEPWPTTQRHIARIRRWILEDLGDDVLEQRMRDATTRDVFDTLDLVLAHVTGPHEVASSTHARR